jgi:hypothetical protein
LDGKEFFMKYILIGTMLLLVTPPVWCLRNRENKDDLVVQLRDAVEVKRSWVLLADLLPPDAPAEIRKALGSVELCSTPQPGSLRVLNSEQTAARLAGQPDLLRRLAIPARITVRYAGWPIAEERVRLAISQFLRQQSLHEHGGISDLPDEARLEWTRPLSATEENPRLEVLGLDWDNRQQSLQVRLRCSIRASCGSFLAHVVLPASLAERWRQQLGLGGDSNSPKDSQQLADDGMGMVLVEKGKPATLIVDNGSMRISVRVTCLQPGLLNQKIRVFEAQSRRVFHANVVAEGLLHANL